MDVKSFGWKRNLDYIKENLLIQLKYTKEYKINLYLSIVINFVYTFSMATFSYIIYSRLEGLLPWEFHEFVFFLIFSGCVALTIGSFYFAANLEQVLLRGTLNSYSTKPINRFLQHFSNSSLLFIGISGLPYFLILIIYIFINIESISFSKLLVSFLFGFLAGFTLVAILRVFESLAFFMKKNSFVRQVYLSPKGALDMFPASIFKGGLAFFVLLFPNAYYNSFVTDYMFGYISFSDLLNYVLYLLLILFVSIFLIVLLWKIGLKKYEAFG